MRIIFSPQETEALAPLVAAIKGLFKQAHMELPTGDTTLEEMLEMASDRYPKMVRSEGKGNDNGNVVVSVPIEDSVELIECTTNIVLSLTSMLSSILVLGKNLVLNTAYGFDRMGKLVDRIKSKST